MGDRNNPIKFGPEWLRNFTPERNSNNSTNTCQNSPTSTVTTSTSVTTATSPGYLVSTRTTVAGPTGTFGITVSPGGTTQSPTQSAIQSATQSATQSVTQSATQGTSQVAPCNSSTNANTPPSGHPKNITNNVPKVLLAKQRYGKEEMFAFYNRTREPPEELKCIDAIFKTRAKTPEGLNSSFQETRVVNARGTPAVSTLQGERFNPGRDVGRSTGVDNRARSRMPFVRQPSTVRGTWQTGNARIPLSAASEDANPLRPWGSNNAITPSTSRTSADQQEWNPNRVFRRRQFYNTNWRQPQSQEEGDKWRSSDAARKRHNVDKWNRDWGERAMQERPQSWNLNRRSWVGGERHSDDNLPEWAVDNAVGGAGTFDSNGAFHGYSSDDISSPKTLNVTYTNSQLQGGLIRLSTDEEGSEDWWDADKVKKLMAKKLDDNSKKLKKFPNDEEKERKSSKPSINKTFNIDSSDDTILELLNEDDENRIECIENMNTNEEKNKCLTTKFSGNKTYDVLVRSDIDVEEVADDTSNFQSVMITQNNSLRQKHQNIVASVSDNASKQNHNSNAHVLHSTLEDSRQSADKYMEHMLEFTLDDSKIESTKLNSMDSTISTNKTDSQTPAHIPCIPTSTEGTNISSNILSMTSAVSISVNQNMSLPTSVLETNPIKSGITQSGGLNSARIQTGGSQVVGIHTGGIQTVGILTSGLQAIDIESGNMQPTGKQGGMQMNHMQPGVAQSSSLQPGNLQSCGVHTGSMPPGGIQLGIMQPSGVQQGGIQSSGLQLGSMQLGTIQSNGMQLGGIQSNGLQLGVMQSNTMQLSSMHTSGMLSTGMLSTGVQPGGMRMGGIQSNGIQSSGIQPGGGQMSSMIPSGIHQSRLQHSMMQQSSMHQNGLQQSGVQQALQRNLMQHTGMQQGGGTLPLSNLQTNSLQSAVLQSGMQIQNPALNSTLGLTFGSGNNGLMLPMQGVPTTVLPNTAPGLGTTGLQGHNAVLASFPTSGLSMMSGSNVRNSSLFLGQNSNPMQSSTDPQIPNRGPQSSLLTMHNLQHQSSQASFGSIYSNVVPVPPGQSSQSTQNLADQWYYQDPENIIQGPFSSKEMYKWYTAGFFSSGLLIRRACETHMRPLGSYGPVVPFAQIELQPFHETNSLESRTQESGGLLNPGGGLQDSLWSQLSSSDLFWMQPTMHGRNESHVNNLPLYFWENQPSNIASSSLVNEDLTKDMKTEDQILEQLRASQNSNTQQTLPFINDQTLVSTSISNKPAESYSPNAGATPDLDELQKLIQTEVQGASPSVTIDQSKVEKKDTEVKVDKFQQDEQSPGDNNLKQQEQNQNKITTDTKPVKTNKTESEKISKNKENSSSKSKTKKSKEEKKDDLVETKNKEEAIKTEQKRSTETSPSKSKKEDKQIKKELEKERKEWIKEGFTVVKGNDKSTVKDTKKKIEDTNCSDDTERKRKEEDKIAIEDKKEKKNIENQRKQQMIVDSLCERSSPDTEEVRKVLFGHKLNRKSPWSAVATQAQASVMDSITLTEIQRLEREKKMEEIRVQQQMMQIIAQQQAAVVAREQEMQAGFGWITRKGSQSIATRQTLVEIQTETRKQVSEAAATAAAAASQVLEQLPSSLAAIPSAPWGVPGTSAFGFWDTLNAQNDDKAEENPQESQSLGAIKKIITKQVVPAITSKKEETSPADEFDSWCTNILSIWSSKIDVPTFVTFLKDLESPYEVKDYVKFYLGESKEAYDFARLFLERRSKLLRVGMVTPSDDLCSPAVAVNPRPSTSSEHQENKGKKGKKKRMQKVDSRILGFLVTASEDRINVGDIDTA